MDVNGNTTVTGSLNITSGTAGAVSTITTTGTAYSGYVSSGADRYFLNFTGAVNSFSVYENSNILYVNSYGSMFFRANQLGGSSGVVGFLNAKVGAGLTSPLYALHAYSSAQCEVAVETSGRKWAILTNTSWSSNGFSIYDLTADVSRVLIDTTGNVGIGKNTPNTKLDVNGNTIISGSLIVSGDVQADFTPMFMLMGA